MTVGGVTVGGVARLLLAALVLDLVLIQPNHPGALTWGALRLFPLELPVLLLGLPLLGDGRAARGLRAALVAVLLLIMVLKGADMGMFTAFARPFNPVGDLPLAVAGFRLLAGVAGLAAAVAAGVLGLVLLAALAALLWWALTVWARLGTARLRPALAGMAGLAAVVAVVDVTAAMQRRTLPLDPPGAAFTARVGAEKLRLVARTLVDLRDFRQLAQADPLAGQAGLLDLIDRDVLVIFVESYGRASFDTPLYAATHRPLLEGAEAELAAAGLAMRSAYLASPTRGGQSWLAHATFANGLRINDQSRYHAALGSGRATLYHLAAQSGFRTAAVMPAITLAWPESRSMGFGRILAAADLGYRGKPFNWVTMPDQFTLAALDRLLRDPPAAPHLFAQVVLISSHAPWVPVPEIVPWEELDDGRVFDAMATAGDPPEVVWRDNTRVRDQYRQSIAYALRAVFGYAARQAGDPPLMIVLGDHQAAGFVALDDRSDVPVHLIGPPALVERAAAWGWAEGLIPSATLPPQPMEAMRDLIVETYSSRGAP